MIKTFIPVYATKSETLKLKYTFFVYKNKQQTKTTKQQSLLTKPNVHEAENIALPPGRWTFF